MTNGLDFERQARTLLTRMGFEAEITRASADGGIDIVAHSKEHITGGKYIIQCKDWSKPVGEPPVRDLYGVVMAEHANKGILITTSTFTAPALKFAENKPLELIDGTKFNQLLSKYNIAVSYNGTLSFENERIEELTEQLNNNPKNIFALKELADIYLIQEDYNKAVELYEILLASKPSVETEKLKNAYEYGVLNYGVALAKLKRYDDALKFFREKGGVCVLIEAYLTHYLGLYEIATSIYQKLKLAGLNRDEFLEKAYLQMQMDSPGLPVFITKNGTEEGSSISLDTAHQKAAQEGRKDLYYPLVMECLDVNREFDRIWRELKAGICQ